MKKLSLMLLTILFALNITQAQNLIKGTWGFDGAVSAIKTDKNFTYVAGSFNYYGPPTGNGAKIKFDDFTPDLNYAKPNGKVSLVVPDGNGGWFIGGDFTMVGDSLRNRLAHLNADGTVSQWNPNPNKGVTGMKLYNNSIYVTGYFTEIGGQQINYTAKLNLTTGEADPAWNPNPDREVLTLDASKGYIYIGGYFNKVNNKSRSFVAKIDANTGELDTKWLPYPTNVVYTIAAAGDAIYMGGLFQSFWGVGAVYYAAKVNDSTGAIYRWFPNPNGYVEKIWPDGDDVYIAGEFTKIGFDKVLDRQFLARVGAAEGRCDNIWDPEVTYYVNDLKVVNGSIYIVGAFNKFEPVTYRPYIAKLDNFSGAVDEDWQPAVDGIIYAMGVSGNDIYLGGNFHSVGGKFVKYLVRLNNDDLSLDDTWLPNPNQPVSTLALDDNYVYASGSFTTIGGLVTNYLARIDKTTGYADFEWLPNPDGGVDAIAVTDSAVFVGGYFKNVGGASRRYIAKLNKTTGAVFEDWNPNPADNLNGEVDALQVHGNYVYASGRFYDDTRTTVINYFKRIDKDSGVEDATWNPQPSSLVWDFKIGSDYVYAAGSFNEIGGQPLSYLAKLNLNDGTAVTNWYPSPDGLIENIAIASGYLYVGGTFQNIGRHPIEYLSRMKIPEGYVDLNWNPDPNSNSTLGTSVYSIEGGEGKIFVGGQFQYMGTTFCENFAVFEDTSYIPEFPGTPKNLRIIPDNKKITLIWSPNKEKNLAGYNIYQSNESGGNFSLIQTVQLPDTSYTITGLKNTKRYYFKITAVNTDGKESDPTEATLGVPNIVGKGLVAYYPFTNGLAADSSGHGNDGVIHKVESITDRFGVSNSAFYFDGDSAYIDCGNGNSLNFTDSLSICFWINYSENQTADIISKWGLDSGYGVTLQNDALDFYLNQISSFGFAGLPKNDWHFIVLTYRAKNANDIQDNAEIYIDGVNKGQGIFANPGSLKASPNSLKIGIMANLAGNYFKGYLDDIRLYNRVLTDSEVKTLFHKYSWHKPQTPQNFKAEAGDGFVKLSWSPSKEDFVTKYYIYSSSNPNTGFSMFKDVYVPDTSYVETNLPNGITYYYKLTAVTEDGYESQPTPAVSATPFGIPETPVPVYPLASDKIEDTTKSITFTWSKVEFADNYELQLSLHSNFDALQTDTTVTGDTLVTIIFNEPLKPFYWRVRAVNKNGAGQWSDSVYIDVITSVAGGNSLPKHFYLYQNYPNPFNPTTKIKFGLPKAAKVNITVYDLLGRQVAVLLNGEKPAGNYSATFNAANLPSGIYFCKLTAGNFTSIKKMILLK